MKPLPAEQCYLQELRYLYKQNKNMPAYSNHNTLSRFKEHFKLLNVERITYRFALNAGLIEPLIHMTPLTWGAAEADWLRVKEMNLTHITVDLLILCGKK